MKQGIRKLLSLLLAAVMLLSVIAPAIPVTPVAAAEVNATAEAPTGDLRIGVLSDIHISYDYVDEVYGNVTGYFGGVQPSRFEKALRFYKAQGVDAVVVAGDLQESSGTTEASLDAQRDWLQTAVDIWFEVFPEKEGEAGYVEPIFIYGNHDSALVDIQYWPEEWGTYQDVFVKEVNGYSFVCAHNAKESLAAPLLEKVMPANQDKPVFYIQHCPVAYTVPGDYGYGVGYGQNGWKNIAPYHNVVALNGHTHVPLTDERSIWQGDEGNEGQFTVLNTATINYNGLNNDGMSVNSYAGNAQQTEHGMIIDVTGSEVSVDRYSFNDMTLDTVTGTVSGNVVKIGQTWQWDACDITDRPYAYDNRVANVNAPVFAEGATVSVDTVTNTAVTVTIPAASIEVPSGWSDMIESYVVEACNPTSGEVEATGRIATSYHVDDKADVYQDTYTVTVSGLKAGTSYTLKVYAQEFFDKRSEPIEVSVTTAGDLTTYRTGDINCDGTTDQMDMEMLQSILTSDNLIYNSAADIDSNGVLETRDIAELQAILDATHVTYPESEDLMDLVHQVKLTGVSTSTSYQPVDYGTTIQNSVVRGDSNQGVKTWTTNYAYYPKTTMYFGEPVDLSGYTHLSFDTLFENEYSVSNSYAKRWMSVSLISGNQEQVASYGSMNFDPDSDGWTTTTIILSNLKNIDLTAVTGIRFEHNFDYYDGRFDGKTEHAIYWDNFYGLVIEGSDSDMLASATITGGEVVYGAGYTKNTSQAVSSTGGSLDITFADALQLSEHAGIYVDMRTPVTTTVKVQPYNGNGELFGSPVSIGSCYIYQNKFISIPAFDAAEDAVAAGLRFTYSCENLLLDNMSTRGSKDHDLIGTADAVLSVGSGVNAAVVLDGTNGSNNALYISASQAVNGGAELTFAEALDLSEESYLRLDIKMESTDLGYGVVLYNTAGDSIWESGALTASSSNGEYATYEIDISSCTDLSDVAKIAFTFDLTVDSAIWVDNLKACDPLEDFFGAATGLIGPSAVQDGFICEILPTTADGHTNVLHWYSDPENGSGTTSAWPGETTVTINKDVLLANHQGYDASSYDYLEFTMKNTGNYVAFTFTFKDASGATLGSSNGEYRVSLEEDWCTYRLDLASAGLTADEVAQIQTISMGWNWQYQNVNGSEAKKVADIFIDNMGFYAYPEEVTDMLDMLGLVRNSEWWWGGHNTYPGAGWLYQSDVTVGSDQAFMFYRSADTHNLGYSPRILYAYFTDPIAVQNDWTISLDVINENFAKNSRLEIIGSDDKAYTCFTFSNSGSYSLETTVSTLVTSDGVAFDASSLTIKGIKYHTNYNRDTSVSVTEGGYLVLDNLTFSAPKVVPVVSLDGLDIIGNSSSVVISNADAVEENFVFELLDTVDGRDHVVHMLADPENGGGYVNANSLYMGAVITLSDEYLYNADGVDYIELNLKNTDIYCDQLYIEVVDASGTKIGSTYKRMAMTNDWSYYRFDLDSLGLTEEELATIAVVKVMVSWKQQLVSAESPVAGEVYIDNLSFGSYVDSSDDLFDHISSVQNVEWWWSGNNTYGGAGWLMEEDEVGNSSFKIYRKTEVYDAYGYNPRRQYLYFDEPITLLEDFVVSIDATNTYMGTGTKISLLGDDGNKYGYLLINQTGTNHYEMAISDFVLLNADTHMTTTATSVDTSSVKIIGAIFHNDFFGGDKTYEGSLVMDNFCIGLPGNSLEDHLATSPGVRRPSSGIEDGYVIEILDSYDGYENVFHVNSNPNNGGGTTTNWPDQPSYYVAESSALFDASEYDYYEFTFKGIGHYSDISVNFLDENDKSLGSVSGLRLSHKDADWMTFRIDLDTAGLTVDEISQVRRVSFGFNWQYQNSTGTALLEADLYWANCGFRCNDEESEDLLDQINSIKNSDYWYGGYNNYPGAGWLFQSDVTVDGDTALMIYRSPETTGLGYSPRTMYHYFNSPVTVGNDLTISMDVINSNFAQASFVDFIGSDGKTYTITTIGAAGTYEAELLVSDLVASDGTAFDAETVTLTGLKFNTYYNPDSTVDKTTGGYLLFDNLTVTAPVVEPEPTEPETTEPEATEPEATEPVVDGGDLLYSASVEYDKNHWAEGTGLTYAKDTENVYGDQSVQSWSFHADADANNNYATAQLHLQKVYDMTDCYLAFDAKYVTESTVGQYIGVRLHKSSWDNQNDVNVGVTLTAGDWNTYVLDFSNVLLSTADLTDLALISFYFDFKSNTGAERMVYIDNVRLLHKETVEDDWVNMSIDSGMSENVTYKVVTDHTYRDSAFAMKVETGSGYRVTFNTQAAVINGTLPGVVDMSRGGYIGGYFYFGDQEPSVKVRLTDKNWNGGATLDLDLIDVGDGWYYAYKDVTNFYFYDSAVNPTKSEIIRVSVNLPSNSTVYIDQFCFPAYLPSDMVDYRIVYDADGSKAVANDAAIRLQNDLSWTVGITPDSVDAVSNEIVLGATARENATVASYLKGGENELGEFDYAVVVEKGKIYLAATTNAGLYQAIDKLVELARAGSIADGVYLKDAYDTADTAELAEGSDIRVMSYNVLYSTEYLVEDRIGNFLNILGYYKPDVIGTQETSSGSNDGWHEYIQDALVADGIYLKACKDSESISGLMTTFLYNPDTVKLLDEYVIDLEEGSQIRVLSVAVFERIADGQQFVVTNTHPAPYGSANYGQNLTAMLTAAKAELAEYSDLPVIMVGDFNTEETADEYSTIMNELGVVDTKYTADVMVKEYDSCPGFGVPAAEGSEFVIDHIFANGNVDTKLYNIVIDHDVENTSDHIPIYADVKLTAPEKDEDFLYNATISNGVQQSDVTNGSLISWKITPSATGWSYPTVTLDKTYDISKYELVMDIYPANMTHFRMHLATIEGKWISGAAVYYGVDKWTTVSFNLSANSEGLTEMTNFGLGIEFGAEGTDYALYIDNVRLVERKVNADATEDTEKASDMLSIANFEWSGSDWSGTGLMSYTKESDETNGKDSLRSWRFSRDETTGAGYARAQIKLNQIYDMTDKDLVFDIKFDTGEEIAAHNFGIIFHDSGWANIFPNDNYMEPTIVAKAGDWYTVRLDNSVLRAYLLEGKDLSAVYLMNFCFQFPRAATDIYIDNMHLEDHVYGTGETDTASDLLANATIVESTADDSVYFYEHSNTSVAYGENSNTSHKFYATAGGSGYHSVKYDLGQSYDLTGKNVVMDVFAFRCSTTFLFQLYDSNNNLITSAYRGCAGRRWSEVTPAVLSSDLDLTDVRYMVIGAHFQADSTLTDRAFYVDNVRIEEIDTYHTALENANMVFIGDSITASGGYKGWSGELEEHYFINRYNVGAGGTSYATISGRGQIYSQVANIPSGVNIDYFVLNGGVNDIWSAWDLGAVSSVSVENATVDSFDTNTTAGGMEQIFCYLRSNYPDAKIAFIITYNCFDSGFDSVRYRDEFVPLAKAVCEKWDVPYLDLVNNDAFNAEFNALPGIHTYDGVHANDVGYDLVMRQLAPWLLNLNDATEQTEQNSDLLSYASYEWSASDWTGASTLSYDNACDVTYGPDSLRSWKFSASAEETGWPAMQIKLSQLQKTSLTGKALQFDVKFEASNGTPSQKIGLRIYDDRWASIVGTNTIWKDVNGSDWQTVTIDASEFEAIMVDGCNLDVVYLVQFLFDFATNAGCTQTVYVDNLRIVDIHSVATEESEASSDLLYGAKYVSGNFTNSGFGYDQYNTMYVNGNQSKYSLCMYASDDATAWCNARFELPEVLDLTNKTLQFDVNQYQHVYIGVAVYNSNNELVSSDGFTLRNAGWQTFEVNLLGGFAEGMTKADLADIKYINFSSSFEYVKTGRILLVDNVQVYENEQYDTALSGLNGLYMGDSISEAISYKGWAGELAEHYNVNNYNVSVSGATLASDGIYSQLAKAPAGVDYDFIMLNGGVNDVWRSLTLGGVSAEGTTEFDSTTAIGALEKIFSTLKATYPDAQICYVLNYVCVQAGYPSDAFANDFAPLARAACEKWGVHCLDLVDNAEFTAEFDAAANVHTYDGVHANTAGYNVLTKYIAPWLESIFSTTEG